jgi:atlastin
MSSTQIFNLTDLIQEDQLQYLQFATEYARFSSSTNTKNCAQTPFQHLIFLIRDWQNKEEHEYGWSGGQAFLNEVLRIKENHDQSSKDLRDYIGNSFKQMECFLMPHPGFKVFAKDFDGRHSLLMDDFRNMLKLFVPDLLNPDKLTVKGSYLRPMSGSELYRNVCSYVRLFQSNTLPEPKNIYETMMETQLSCVVDNSLNKYRNLINEREPTICTEQGIIYLHNEALEIAMKYYLDSPKMGDPDDERTFKDSLVSKIELDYETWRRGTLERLKREEAERLREEEAKRYAAELQNRDRRLEELENEQRFPVMLYRGCQNQLTNPCNMTIAVGLGCLLLILIF